METIEEKNERKIVSISWETHRDLMLAKYKFHFATLGEVISWLLKEKGLQTTEPPKPKPKIVFGKDVPVAFKEIPVKRDFGSGEPPKEDEKEIIDDGKMTFKETKPRL
jgi:hypothetical protein